MFTFTCKLFYNSHAVGKDGMVTLYISVYIGIAKARHQRKNFNLSLRWPVKYVDLKKNRVKSRFKGDTDASDYNMVIMSELSKINEVAKIYRLTDRVLTIEILERELYYSNIKKSVIGFMTVIRKERYRNGEIVERTYKNHLGTINAIKEFAPKLTFSEIDEKWIRSFANFLRKRNNHNTVWTRIKILNSYLRIAIADFNIYVDESVFKYKIKPEYRESVYLNHKEVKRLINIIDFSLTKTQLNVLKAFLFCCFTGIRISDVYKSQYNWMVSENFIRFTMQKNKSRRPKTIMIPLIPIAKSLITNIQGGFFDLPTEQEYNRTLKELARYADIKKNLTSHVARHTFGYLFMTRVGNLFALKKTLGHSKISTTEKYAHLDDDYNLRSTMRIQDDFEDQIMIKKML